MWLVAVGVCHFNMADTSLAGCCRCLSFQYGRYISGWLLSVSVILTDTSPGWWLSWWLQHVVVPLDGILFNNNENFKIKI